jgi:hypothetical protein
MSAKRFTVTMALTPGTTQRLDLGRWRWNHCASLLKRWLVKRALGAILIPITWRSISKVNHYGSNRSSGRAATQVTGGRGPVSAIEKRIGRRVPHSHGDNEERTGNCGRAAHWNIEDPAAYPHQETDQQADNESHSLTPSVVFAKAHSLLRALKLWNKLAPGSPCLRTNTNRPGIAWLSRLSVSRAQKDHASQRLMTACRHGSA